jgi:membrane protease YdiL (CAAX protease family)
MGPRRWFHILLGATFLPCLTLPVVWGSAIYWGRRATETEERRWAKRILGLAVLDTVLVIALGVMIAKNDDRRSERSSPKPRVVIGIVPDSAFQGPGVRVASVLVGSPAATAGIQVGDVVTGIAGTEIRDVETLRRVLAEQEPGKTVTVNVTRAGSASNVEVTPRWSDHLPQRQVGIFESRAGSRACFSSSWRPRLLPWVIILGVIAALGVLASRRGSGKGVWLTGLSLVGAAVGAYAASGGTCVALGGPTAAAGAFTIWGWSLGLAGTALIARKLINTPVEPSPTKTVGQAVRLGFWYSLTGTLRLTIILGAISLLMPESAAPPNPIESFAPSLGSVERPGVLLVLLAVPVIFLGPLGEEVAFRGLLLSSLTKWMGTAAAITISAVLFASLHWYYGIMLPVVVLAGAVLGWTKIATGGLRAPIIVHSLINSLSFLFIALQAMRSG